VLAQQRTGLQVAGRAENATAEDAGHVIWATLPVGRSDTAAIVRRDLRRRRSTTLAGDVAPQYGLAVAAGRAVYATTSAPPRLVAVRTDGGGRVVLSRNLASSITSRGSRVAWAEQEAGRQRIVVRDMARGKDFVAADVPACDHGGCYRVDAVTLADRGVVVARGAIGSQPSSILRRRFSARRPESVRIPHDPQPDLIPSSTGAAYFVLGRGWYRWDFGAARPVGTKYGVDAVASPIRYESGRWYLERRGACGNTITAEAARGAARAVVAPTDVLAIAGASRTVCPTFLGLTTTARGVVTTWAVSPEDSHSEAGVTGVIAFARAGG
jgi:hypothetical protein